MKVQTLF